MSSSRVIIRPTVEPKYDRRTDAHLRLEARHLQMLRDLYGSGWRSEFGRQMELCSIRGFKPKRVKPTELGPLEPMAFPMNTHQWEQLGAMWQKVDEAAAALVEHLASGAEVPWPKVGSVVDTSTRQAGTVTRSGNKVVRSLSLEFWLSDKAERLRGLRNFSEYVSWLIRRDGGEIVPVVPQKAEDIRDKVKVPMAVWLTPAERDALDKQPGGRRRFVQGLIKEHLTNKKGDWL